MGRKSASEDVFRALADPTRRKLLDRLLEGDMPVMDLAASFRMTLPAISQHLKVLRETGLVSETRHGRQRVYTLNATPLEEVVDWLSHYERFWKARLRKLREHLEKNQ